MTSAMELLILFVLEDIYIHTANLGIQRVTELTVANTMTTTFEGREGDAQMES